MASSFSRMATYVADGAIRVIELQAVPRSMSTVLGRCLNESGTTSVFLNELFNRRNTDLDVAAEYVVRAVQPHMSAASPVVVLTKNMARFLDAPAFGMWTDVCSSVVWCIRDPRVQIPSLITRTANDLFFGVGSDRLKQGDLLPVHFATVTEYLLDSELSTDFSKTGWRAIGEHFSACADSLASFVSDGSLLSQTPDLLLRYLCASLGLDYRDRMINGWEEPFVNVSRLYHPELDDATDAWIKQAATSRGIAHRENPPLDESVLPEALRDHLHTEAIPTYERFMKVFHAQGDRPDIGSRPVAGCLDRGQRGSQAASWPGPA